MSNYIFRSLMLFILYGLMFDVLTWLVLIQRVVDV